VVWVHSNAEKGLFLRMKINKIKQLLVSEIQSPIQFSSTVKNGVIHLPKEYADLENITVNVTLHTVSNRNDE